MAAAIRRSEFWQGVIFAGITETIESLKVVKRRRLANRCNIFIIEIINKMGHNVSYIVNYSKNGSSKFYRFPVAAHKLEQRRKLISQKK